MRNKIIKYIQYSLIFLFIGVLLLIIIYLLKGVDGGKNEGRIITNDEYFERELDVLPLPEIMPDPDVSFTDQLKGVAESRFE